MSGGWSINQWSFGLWLRIEMRRRRRCGMAEEAAVAEPILDLLRRMLQRDQVGALAQIVGVATGSVDVQLGRGAAFCASEPGYQACTWVVVDSPVAGPQPGSRSRRNVPAVADRAWVPGGRARNPISQVPPVLSTPIGP